MLVSDAHAADERHVRGEHWPGCGHNPLAFLGEMAWSLAQRDRRRRDAAYAFPVAPPVSARIECFCGTAYRLGRRDEYGQRWVIARCTCWQRLECRVN